MSRYIKDTNDNWQLSSGMPQIDDELDITSENPVQNKVITSEIQTLENNDDAMLNVLGAKNLLSNNATSQVVNGVTFTVNPSGYPEGTVNVNGTASEDTWFGLIGVNWSVYSKRNYGNCYLSGGISDEIQLQVYWSDDGSTWGGTIVSRGNDALIPNKNYYTQVFVFVKSGTTVNNVIVYPMIRPASIIDDTYAPYSRTNQELAGEVEPMLNTLGAKNLCPNNATTQTLNGVTFTVNSDGTIKANGTSTSSNTMYFDVTGEFTIKAGDYIVNGCPTGGSSTTYGIAVSGASKFDYGDGAPISYTEDIKKHVYIVVFAGATLSNITFKPMLRPASIQDDTYVPYAMTNRKLTLQSIKVESVTDTTDSGGFISKTFPTNVIVLNAWTTASDRYCEFFPSNGSTIYGRSQWWFKVLNVNTEQAVSNTQFTVHIAYVKLD